MTVDEIEASNRSWHGVDQNGNSVRWKPYKPDYTRQTGLRGRWQAVEWSSGGEGDFFKWRNCDRPTSVSEETTT